MSSGKVHSLADLKLLRHAMRVSCRGTVLSATKNWAASELAVNATNVATRVVRCMRDGCRRDDCVLRARTIPRGGPLRPA